MRVEIITTRHWMGDARLNRHVAYLQEGGHAVRIRSFSDLGRFRSLVSALGAAIGSSADILILPDPELFAIGSLAARLSGKRAVVDIHEDYPGAARNRSWIPRPLKPAVTLLAGVVVALGRKLAWRVIVAAPQLSRTGDSVVLNVADPSALTGRNSGKDPALLVYVGDITNARGAMEMIEVLAGLSQHRLLLIGPISSETRTVVTRVAEQLGVTQRVQLTGRLTHDEAWRMASGAQFGLSLLHDTPAYRDAVATKLWEYLGLGIVPIVSALPGQAAFVSRLDPRLVCSTPDEVTEVVTSLYQDDAALRDLSLRARDLAERDWDEARPDRALRSVFTLDR